MRRSAKAARAKKAAAAAPPSLLLPLLMALAPRLLPPTRGLALGGGGGILGGGGAGRRLWTPTTARVASSAVAAAESAAAAAERRPSSGAEGRKKHGKKRKKERSVVVDRRKSPALWRYDLTPPPADNDDADEADGAEPSSLFPSRPPEIMSPAGGFPQLRAAVSNGADAVYLGLSSYSARARASNFDLDELSQAVEYAHRHGVKVYVALNTLVFDSELEEVAGLLGEVRQRGADAVIVQDLGVTRLAGEVAPDLEIHASTQQTVTDWDGAAFATEAGRATRVVLGRELSVEELADVTRRAARWGGGGVETEAFVHGALCVSYSGQCFSSEEKGGRSANRGQCAQACRLPYGLIADGELRHLGDMSYLLSPQDLCGLDHVPDLVRSGVSCLKIEGRLKDEAYVAATTRAYRTAVDEAWADLQKERGLLPDGDGDGDAAALADKSLSLPSETVTRTDLLQLFSRGQDASHPGLTPGFFDGPRHQSLVRGRSPRHRGVHLGVVSSHTSASRGLLVVECDGDNGGADMLRTLKRGDGLVIDRGRAQEEELGGPAFEVSEVRDHGDGRCSVGVKFGRDVTKWWREADLGQADRGGHGDRGRGRRGDGGGRRRHQGDRGRPNGGGGNRWRIEGDNRNADSSEQPPLLVPVGAHVWRTSDASVSARMRKLAAADPPRTFVGTAISGRVGEPLRVTLTLTSPDGERIVAVGESDGVLEHAKSAGDGGGTGLSPDKVRRAVGLLGGTGFALRGGPEAIDVAGLEDGSWCPVGFVKGARRRAVEDLERLATAGRGGLAEEEDAADPGGKREREDAKSAAAGAVGHLLDDLRTKAARPSSSTSTAAERVDADEKGSAAAEAPVTVGVSVLCRTYEQVDAICRLAEERASSSSTERPPSPHRVDEIVVDFLEVSGMREAVSRIRSSPLASSSNGGLRVAVASPRILKPGEAGIWRTLLRLEPDGLLVRSAGLLRRMNELGGEGAEVDVGWGAAEEEGGTAEGGRGEGPNVVRIPRLLGDFSLNAANAISALSYLSSGLSRIAASYDLGARAVSELARLMGGPGSPGASRLEAVVHSHLPVFHTEHCVFARFLSKGNSYLDCGHACTRHDVHLRDEDGKDNLVLADMGCRNTVFAAEARSGAYSLDEWMSAGVGRVRIELVDEGPDDARRVAGGYLDLLDGNVRPKQLWEVLGDVRDSNGRRGGVGVGSLRNGAERRAGELA